MKTFNLLVLTDHRGHSAENSLYPFLRAFREHSGFGQIVVASRGMSANQAFFNGIIKAELWGNAVDTDFQYSINGDAFDTPIKLNKKVFDVIWLRLPPPLDSNFLNYLEQYFNNKIIINKPSGIIETANKAFLFNFPELIAPSWLFHSFEELAAQATLKDLVIKPLNSYGGKGIFRIVNKKVDFEGIQYSLDVLREKLSADIFPILGVQFLKNVSQGDKRIIVVDGEILGASLRLPKKGNWLCNVSMGGSSQLARPNADELNIIKTIHPRLKKLGIFMYGIDTLVDDTGKRVLSEVNSTSIGGLPQIATYSKEPLVEKLTSLFYKFCLENYNNK